MANEETPHPRSEKYDGRSAFYGLVAGLLCAVLYLFNIGERYELISYDQRMRWLPRPEYECSVGMVAVNAESLNVFGKWPWTGTRFSDLHKGLLEQYEAKSVVYDIIFDATHILSDLRLPTLGELFDERGILCDPSEPVEVNGNPIALNELPIQVPSRYSKAESYNRLHLGDQPLWDVFPSRYPHILSGILGDWQFEQEFQGQAEEAWWEDDGDEELAIQPGRGFLACIFQVPSEGELEPTEMGQYQISDDTSLKLFDRFTMNRTNIEGGNPPHAVNLILPRDNLLEAAAGVGSTLPTKDMDGVVRRAPLVIEYKSKCYPSLHLQAACDYLNIPLNSVRVRWGRHILLRRADGSTIHIPIDRQGRMTLKYRWQFADFPKAPFHSVAADIEARVEQPLHSMFQGRIALVGAAAEAMGDLWASPIARAYPGMATLVTGIDNIIHQDFLFNVPRWLNALAIGAIGLIIGLLGGVLREAKLGLLALAFLAVYWAFAAWLFIEKSYWINMVHVSASGFLAFGLISIHHVIQEQRNRKYVRHVLGKLVSEAVAEELAGSLDPSKLVLGGELHRNTMLFTDLSGFTSLSEKVSAQQMVGLLNEYFGEMVAIIDEEKGYVNKFMGDAIMVIYGHPLTYSDHALRAVRTAVLMQKKNHELQAEWESKGLPILRMRVGVNTGEVVTGNIGSENRIEYSVIGDNVNLAQRLESNAPVDGIMISEATYNEVADHVIVEKREPIKVKGKAEPVQVYVVHDLKEAS